MKLKFSQQIFELYSSSKFHENPPIGTELFHADWQIWRSYSRFSQIRERA